MIPRWVERYAGMRFVDGGRSWPRVDCWGAIALVLSERAGIEVQAYGDTPAAELLAVARTMQADSAARPWVHVDEPRPLDVVTMTGDEKVEGRKMIVVCHVGIMVSETHMLHVERATDAAIVPLNHWSVKPRVQKFYRHEALC